MIFTEAEKSVFAYPHPDGKTILYADPLAIRRELISESQNQFDKWLSEVKTEETISAIPDETVRSMEIAKQARLQGQFAECMRKAIGKHQDSVIARKQEAELGHKWGWCKPIDLLQGDGFPDAWVLSTLQLFLDWLDQKKTIPN
jgi:hypothetical protein